MISHYVQPSPAPRLLQGVNPSRLDFTAFGQLPNAHSGGLESRFNLDIGMADEIRAIMIAPDSEVDACYLIVPGSASINVPGGADMPNQTVGGVSWKLTPSTPFVGRLHQGAVFVSPYRPYQATTGLVGQGSAVCSARLSLHVWREDIPPGALAVHRRSRLEQRFLMTSAADSVIIPCLGRNHLQVWSSDVGGVDSTLPMRYIMIADGAGTMRSVAVTALAVVAAGTWSVLNTEVVPDFLVIDKGSQNQDVIVLAEDL